ncbi:MAG: tRNA lysidine(34) synthetase TilS [Proteobacteria bacterium]|nr:tRNA lysidine(34) synthetase TilS [Pseudomonadota bacterium]
MPALLSRLRAWIDGQDLIARGSHGLVAFSGGPDSLCLLDLLLMLGRERGISLRALHVDHRLRPDSASQAQQAAAQARGLGATVVVHALTGLDPGAGNLQERARLARRAALEQAAQASAAQWIALGHTADDQAETVLMRLLRGSGVGGLAAMAPVDAPWVRPLLTTTRAEILAHLEARGLSALADPSNADPRHLRSRVRHLLLPALTRENPALSAAFGRLAQHCREEDQALDTIARALFASHRGPEGLRLLGLRELPVAILHRVLRLHYAATVGSLRGLSRAHVQQLAALVGRCRGSERLDLPMARAERRYDTLVLAPRVPATTPRPGGLRLEREGRSALADGRSLELRRLAPGETAACAEVLPLRALNRGLELRSPRSGDRIAIAAGRHRRVARLLIDLKVPRAERADVLLVCAEGEVLLVLGLRRAFGQAPGPDEASLHFALDPPPSAAAERRDRRPGAPLAPASVDAEVACANNPPSGGRV